MNDQECISHGEIHHPEADELCASISNVFSEASSKLSEEKHKISDEEQLQLMLKDKDDDATGVAFPISEVVSEVGDAEEKDGNSTIVLDEEHQKMDANATLDNLSRLPQSLSFQQVESLKCIAPGCRHQAQNQGGLILHLHTHFKFELASDSTSSETKFSYVSGKYQCLLCPLVTPHRIVFGEHVRHHLLSHPYNCAHCGCGAESVPQLRAHNRQLHRLLLVKLVVNENEHVDAIMSRLGPQAPRTKADKAMTLPTASPADESLQKTQNALMSPTSSPAKESQRKCMQFSESGEDKVSEKELIMETKATSEVPEEKLKTNSSKVESTVKQNFKYLLTNERKFGCAECRHATSDVAAFAVHVFDDIHRALRNSCGECHQRGTNQPDFKSCPIVDKIIKALVKQKDYLVAQAKKAAHEDKNGNPSTASRVISSSQSLVLLSTALSQDNVMEKSQDSSIEKSLLSAEAVVPDPKSPFEETMAMLRDLTGEGSCLPNTLMFDSDAVVGEAPQGNEGPEDMEKSRESTENKAKEQRCSLDRGSSAMNKEVNLNLGAAANGNDPSSENVDKSEPSLAKDQIGLKDSTEKESDVSKKGAPSNVVFNHEGDGDIASELCIVSSHSTATPNVENLSRHSSSESGKDREERNCNNSSNIRFSRELKDHSRMSIAQLESELSDRLAAEKTRTNGASSRQEYNCGVLECQFSTTDDICFKLHYMVKHTQLKVTCTMCRQRFSSEDTLLNHMKSEHGSATPAASATSVSSAIPVASAIFAASATLAASASSASLPTPTASATSAASATPAASSAPAASAAPERGIYPCTVAGCESFFNRITELTGHCEQHHPDLGRSLPCCFCFLEFSARAEYASHVQTHVKNIMKCTYCKEVYDTKEGLLSHIVVDHVGKPKRINIAIKILNDDRAAASEKKAKADDGKKESAGMNSDSPEANDAGEIRVRTTRKSTNPLKRPSSGSTRRPDPGVRISSASVPLAQKCVECTFTCNSALQLKMHAYECHEKRATGDTLQAFACRYCKMTTDVKETLQRHTAHHTGKHTIRYYVCPYCRKQSNQMSVIEDHVTDEHPSEVFKFEVLQDSISYLQDMVECPLCAGASFTWKLDFLHHLGSVHRLEDLVAHLESSGIPDRPSPTDLRVPRHLFKDLLPPQSPVAENIPEDSEDEEIEEAMEEGMVTKASKDGLILRYHCEVCEFSGNDFATYRAHMKRHGAAEAGSLSQNSVALEEPKEEPEDLPLDAPKQATLTSRYGPAAAPKSRDKLLLRCHLCPFECTKTLNYRRHLGIHERNETMTDGYKCGYCHFLHDRINVIKFHLGKYHGELVKRMFRIAGGVETEMNLSEEALGRVRSRPSLAMTPLDGASSVTASPDVDGTPSLVAESIGSSRERRVPKRTNRWSENWESTTFSAAGRLQRMAREQSLAAAATVAGRRDSVAADYLDSSLPPGMIYAEPMKCPKCEFTNRVRVNLVRHMKLHREEEERARACGGAWRVSEGGMGMVGEAGEGVGEERWEEGSNVRSSEFNEDGSSFGDLPIKPEPMDEADDLPNRSDSASVRAILMSSGCGASATVAPTTSGSFHSLVSPIKSEPVDGGDLGSLSNGGEYCNGFEEGSQDGGLGEGPDGLEGLGDNDLDSLTAGHNGSAPGGSSSLGNKRMFKCAYCAIVSRWNRRDISLHVLHVHMQRRVYGCGHCAFGTSKSSAVVMAHHSRDHPSLPLAVRDDLTTFNAIVPLSADVGGVVPVAYVRPDGGGAIMELGELRRYMAARGGGIVAPLGGPSERRAAKEEGYGGGVGGAKRGAASAGFLESPVRKTARGANLDQPLDLSLRLEGELGEQGGFDDGGFDDALFDAARPAGAGGMRIAEGSLWKCRLCKFQNQRPIRVRNHIVCNHLKLKPFCCPHCRLYAWKAPVAVAHIVRCHPGMSTTPLTTALEKRAYIERNMSRIQMHGLPIPPGTVEATPGGYERSLAVFNRKQLGLAGSVVSRNVGGMFSKFKLQKPSLTIRRSSSDAPRPPSIPRPPSSSSRSPATLPNRDGASPRSSTMTPLNRDGSPRPAIALNRDGSPRCAFYRCKLCGYQEARHDKTKYHVIKHHLKLGLFSCPHCHKYLWGRQYVIRHIREAHPGREVKVRRTFDEYEDYLRDSIRKIGGLPTPIYARQYNRAADVTAATAENPAEISAEDMVIKSEGENLEDVGTAELPCELCEFVATTDVQLTAHRRTHVSHECSYCDFKHTLAAKVQSHCLSRHPSRPVRYRKCQIGVTTPAGGESSTANHGGASIASANHDAVFKSSLSATANEKIASDGKRAIPLPVQQEFDDDNDSSSEMLVIAEGGEENEEGDKERDREGGKERGGEEDEEEDAQLEMFMCRYCHQLTWTIDEVRAHLRDLHPREAPEFELIRQPTGKRSEALRAEAGGKGGAGEGEIDDGSRHSADQDGYDAPLVPNSTLRATADPSMVYKCRRCPFHAVKLTVMRHHVMSHLAYHPYRCPYCAEGHAVKSSPVLKHVRIRHPDEEARVECVRTAAMERAVREAYGRARRDGTEAATQPSRPLNRQPFRTEPTIPPSRLRLAGRLGPLGNRFPVPKANRRAFYRCTFCALVTHMRTDMRHHLMREMHYKPFTCGYCAYTEPSKSGMGKHFRSKHAGLVVDIRDLSSTETDAKIERMLDECMVRPPDNDPPHQSSLTGPSQESPDSAHGFSHQHTSLKSRFKPRVEAPLLRIVGAALKKKKPKKKRGAVDKGWGGFGASKGAWPAKTHRCPHCAYSSSTLRPLQAHMINHQPFRLQCGYCDHRSHYPSWIRKHIRNTHHGRPFKYRRPSSTANLTADQYHDHDEGPDEVTGIKVERAGVKVKVEPWVGSQLGGSGLSKVVKSSGAVPAVLDGVPLDIAVAPDYDGVYRCPQCEYYTANRSHYKMHSVIHQPRKWKCYYCDQKFPLIFRLRRHFSQKHPLQPVRWIDIATGQTCDNTTMRVQSPAAAVASLRHTLHGGAAGGGASSQRSKPGTARKSIRAAEFSTYRSAAFHSRHPAKRPRLDLGYGDGGSASDNTVDYEEASDKFDVDDDAYLEFCCHRCPSRFDSLPGFAEHLRRVHSRQPASTVPGSLPALEILPAMGEGELTLQRCGFCESYESFFKADFDAHVRAHTAARPKRCSRCQYASFRAADIVTHAEDCHPGEVTEVQGLEEPYTMTSSVEGGVAGASASDYNFEAIVRLVDVVKEGRNNANDRQREMERREGIYEDRGEMMLF